MRTNKRALAYLLRAKPRRRLWELDVEHYVTEGAPGQTTFNSNTTADVLIALAMAGYRGVALDRLVRWFRKHQNDDGSWHLGANDKEIRDVSTWSTAEALFALDLADRVYDENIIPRLRSARRHAWWVACSALLLVAYFLLASTPLPEAATHAWMSLPEKTRELVAGGVVVGLVVNLVAALVWEIVRSKIRGTP